MEENFNFQTNPFQYNRLPGTSRPCGKGKANRNAIWEGGLSSGEQTSV